MVKASIIAKFLNRSFQGDDIEIRFYSTISDIQEHSLVFAKKFDEDYLAKVNRFTNILAIVTDEYKGKISCSYILSENPRLDYLKILQEFFVKEKVFGIHSTVIIENGTTFGKDIFIGANCYVGKNVVVGDGTRIYPNVVIHDGTVIGKNCCIKSGAVIGQDGFGFELDEKGVPVHFPHFGRVIIGDEVYIGANTAVDRGTLGDTIIADHVKIDNLVHVAHNDKIGENSLVIAGASLGGGVELGKNCWIAPNASVKQQTVIGDFGYVGLGAVVIKNVEEHTIVVGNPAKELRK
ncbi:UDP-3-O-(3-hydroxymyristoyl)glucosamine N-acyltransferase [Gabonibacter massiliensis]|uniref:UDP-3-O-(3-hydroxymyristoyl)glucosamine N-acyltransferase n=1 Tax=Gabonibacter massiliensis TaxID=1720195 RepID=UPI000AC7B7A1|nr:UDP-3-O-(3-hydroxymyristoyl)glucosamine N-acyltransferase [Gabonibacter massiliensis]